MPAFCWFSLRWAAVAPPTCLFLNPVWFLFLLGIYFSPQHYFFQTPVPWWSNLITESSILLLVFDFGDHQKLPPFWRQEMYNKVSAVLSGELCSNGYPANQCATQTSRINFWSRSVQNAPKITVLAGVWRSYFLADSSERTVPMGTV